VDQSTRRTAYRLRFEDLDGLVVRVRKPSFRGLKKLARVVGVLGDDLRGQRVDGQARLDAWELLFAAFADALIDWDLTDGGKPVPATRKGVYGQDVELLLTITTAWYRQVVLRSERPAPAERASTRARRSTAPAVAVSPSGPSAEELALLSIPVELGNDALTAHQPERPEERGVQLSLDPEIAAAQEDAWRAAPEPAASEPVEDHDDAGSGDTVEAVA
jgi:hypothetical protein